MKTDNYTANKILKKYRSKLITLRLPGANKRAKEIHFISTDKTNKVFFINNALPWDNGNHHFGKRS